MPRERDRGRSMRRMVHGLAAVLLAVSVAGCPKWLKAIFVAPPGGTTTLTGGGRSPCDGPPSSKEEVLAALYSIFYRAAQAGSHDPVAGWAPVPLMKAARILLCDPDDAVRFNRIRNAVVQLATGTYLLECRHAPPPQIQEFRTALIVLGVPDLLVQRLHHQLACTLLAPPAIENATGGVIDGDPVFEDFQRACCPCVTDCNIGPWGRMTVAEFRVEVNRDSTCIFQAIDPQCWDDVVPLNFENTFVTDLPACVTSGTVPVPVCRTPRSCDPSQTDPVPMSTAPQPMAPWCGNLSEKVKASAHHITTTMDTVLKVRTSQPKPTDYKVEYGLCESREYRSCDDTCGNPTQPCPYCDADWCAVERDCGEADVQPASPGSAVLHGSKQLQFKSGLTPDLNAWAQVALKVMVEEVASATCRPPSCAGATGPACPSTSGGSSTPSGTQCTCPGPYDSCTLLTEIEPKDDPALCP